MSLVKQLARRGLASEVDESVFRVFADAPISEQLLHDITVLAEGAEVDVVNVSSSDLAVRLSVLRRAFSDEAVSEIGARLESEKPDVDQISISSGPDDEPVVRLLDSLIEAAIDRGASDIHIDLENGNCLIRMRVDGVLSEYAKLPVSVQRPLLGRMKIVAGMDITESRRPQDGAISRQNRDRNLDIRVATIPGKYAERAVMRLFQASRTRVTLPGLGIGKRQEIAVLRALSSQEGLILVCGPTGSGKTTTIYAMLETLKHRGLNIMTIEDPIEVDLEGVAQSQVNLIVGYDFHSGLRALLRQDPDVILVGEIRDETTADAAIRSALTGHLVIATVHANSPAGAVSRLVNLGVDLSLVADALIGVFNQRLVRTYCPRCAEYSCQSESHHSRIPTLFPGCPDCYHTGFKGRRPVVEHVLLDSNDRHEMMGGKISLDPGDTLADAARGLFRDGIVPLFEVCRVGGGLSDDV
jgi:type II secretory ATPase GspE/PulE/Tfp pilus assembly ATPase PilB-like protein